MIYQILIMNARAINRNRFLFVVIILCGIILLLFYLRLKPTASKEDIEDVVNWVPRRSIKSCHISRKHDALPLLRKNATLPEKSIFFIETSCSGGLTSRQACAVESAARAHPRHQINVLFTSAVSEQALGDGSLKILSEYYKNVKLARVRISDFVLGTPIEIPVLRMPDHHLSNHISKIMRYLTLFKYSGIYLNLDVIVAKSFDDLWQNWVIRETPMSLSHDMFSFSRNPTGRKLAQIAMGFLRGELSISRQHDFWSYNGPNVMTHLLEHWCTTQKVEVMSLATCSDLGVYGPDLFVPISFYDRQVYFKAVNWNLWKNKNMYTYIVWERFTKFNIIFSSSLYGKLANEYCPRVYRHFGDDFIIGNLSN